MIALDTNILVRIVVEDDEAQVNLARRLLQRSMETQESCLVTLVVLCELQWVLGRIYRASRQESADVVEMLLKEDVFVIEETGLVEEALERFRSGKADLPDYLIGARGRSLGADSTFTFDTALRRETGFTLLEESALQG